MMTFLLVPAFLIFQAGSQPASSVEQVAADASVKRALDVARRSEAEIVDEQVRLCEIPAPPFKETARAEAYRRLFQTNGLKNVRIDSVGNVIGERPGLGPRPNVVISAHLDTVFPEGTDVRTSRTGSVVRGPGISDDCRGLAVVLGVLRALNSARVQTTGTLTFVGTVGEEGLGDLRGVKHLFDSELKGRIDRFISVDGAGLGITSSAVGSRRYRIGIKGPGGHSWGAFGIVNPVHALGRAIARIAEFSVPAEPKTTFNVGRIGGGTSVNSIAFDAWMEVDMRSADSAALTALDANFHRALDAAVAEEQERWGGRGRLEIDRKLVGNRPGGRVPESAAIVQTAISATKALGLPVSIEESSTDSNYPISLGIPAVTIDGGGRGTGSHSIEETFDTTDSWQGTARALLLAVALAR